jgi:2',3'-cyclic-nucleotide 2'-phosphodiesterase (5'-nucleotidase family)
VILVEGGGWVNGRTESARFQNMFLADMMGEMGYDVVNVGPTDIMYGVDALKEVAKKNHFRLVSTNIVEEATGEPVFEPSVIMEKGGVKIAFLGVVSRTARLDALEEIDNAHLGILDPVETLNKRVPELRDKVDLVIVFAHVGSRKAQALVDEVRGIDVAVAGGDGFVSQRAVESGDDEIGRSLTVMAGDRGKYVGVLDMVISDKGDMLRFENTVYGLDKNVTEDKEIADKVEAFKVELREVRKREAVESVVGQTQNNHPTEKFVGANTCQRCHEAAYNAWSNSAHAHSMASLEGESKEGSSQCLQCHVTGYDQSNGFTVNRSELASVSCEQCHGYGTTHGSPGFIAKPGVESCKVCHDQKNSPDFDYHDYWEAIAH